MNLEVGSTVGDYQVIDVLGAGGMGKVFKVRNTISNRVEAMKILLPDLSGEPELADRFLREIQVLARLEHPNIAGLRTALRSENQLLMVMEFVEGMALDKRLRQGPLPVHEAVRCIDQILAALAYAHKSGVIHRDIKPANMMLMPDGTVKLMDFGIAKGADDRRLTMTGGTMGSVYYMSPEQIRGNVVVDARSDLYSVGVSLYELVTGKHAFDGDSQFAILGAHLEKSPVPPIAIDPKLPQALNDLILLSVTREPDLRFQTADAFRNALKSVSEATLLMDTRQPAAVTPATPTPAANAAAAAPPVTARVAKSNRALWATLGALCFVVVLVGAIQFGPWKKAAADSPPPKAAAAPQQQLVVVPAAPSNPPAETPGTGRAARGVPHASRLIRASHGAPIRRHRRRDFRCNCRVSAADTSGGGARRRHRRSRSRCGACRLPHSGRNCRRSRIDGAAFGARGRNSQHAAEFAAQPGGDRPGDAHRLGAGVSLMDTYLQGTSDALAAGDAAAAETSWRRASGRSSGWKRR